ncbi:hypothetical protein Sjap_010789 [Stephania japonica]|uniref:50S ribosomal protein L35 n=1 Tax=Stephania japonica TaxID=461633 RepID=A0AAP0J9U3_9MAGN
MASSSTPMLHFSFTRPFSPSLSPNRISNTLRIATPHPPNPSLKLSSSHSISTAFTPALPINLSISPSPRKLTIVAAKGYKMKTHKASAKRFRVTGNGKIVRRRAGKQHLLEKKNTKRKCRLSKMHPVSRSDYDNVIGALPYLKVNRLAK